MRKRMIIALALSVTCAFLIWFTPLPTYLIVLGRTSASMALRFIK